MGWMAGVRFLVATDARRRWRSAVLVALGVAVALGIPAAALVTPGANVAALDRIARPPSGADARSHVAGEGTADRLVRCR